MRKRASPLRNLILLLALGAALVAAIGGWRTLSVTGEAALAKMDAEELAFLRRLQRLDAGMSRAEVEAVLGPADRWTGLGADEAGHWSEIPGAPLASLSVHIDHGAASRLRWLKIGAFTYRLDLPPRGGPDGQ